mmetsp:Transcript_11845/g.16793  ORF Transcript_11845/g.16793 Transcript_11845/m.16793 type:complete len:329 (+) Transcript_11845:634-1620(+)
MKISCARQSFHPIEVVGRRNTEVVVLHHCVVVVQDDLDHHACEEVRVDHHHRRRHHEHLDMDNAVVVHLDMVVEDSYRTLVVDNGLLHHHPYLVDILPRKEGVVVDHHHDIPAVVVVLGGGSPNIVVVVVLAVVVVHVVVVVVVHDSQVVDHDNPSILQQKMLEGIILILRHQKIVVAMVGWIVLHDHHLLQIQRMIHVRLMVHHRHYHHHHDCRKNWRVVTVSKSYQENPVVVVVLEGVIEVVVLDPMRHYGMEDLVVVVVVLVDTGWYHPCREKRVSKDHEMAFVDGGGDGVVVVVVADYDHLMIHPMVLVLVFVNTPNPVHRNQV